MRQHCYIVTVHITGDTDMQKYKNAFRRQSNSAKLYHEVFYVSKENTSPLQENSIVLNAYGDSSISPGGSTYHSSTRPKVIFEQWSIELITSGSGEFICGDKHENLYPGTVCIIQPHCTTEIRAAADSSLNKQVLMIERSPVLSLLCNMYEGYELLRFTDISLIAGLFNKIKDICVSGHPDQRMELSVLVYRLLLVLGRQRQSLPSKRSIPALIRKIVGNPAEDYTRESMAQMLGVNIRTLTKSFQDSVDCAPMQFVIQARMKLAKQLLETETMPIYQVAETCGYQCEAYFSSEFKKHFGCSPREYVKRLE